MKCLNCNNDFDNVNDSCPKCGYKINEKYLNYIQDKKVIENLAEYKNTNNNSNNDIINGISKNIEIYSEKNNNELNNITKELEREDYVEIYVGKNYSKFVNGGISWPCLLLGDFYLLYRKMYSQIIAISFSRILSSLVTPLVFIKLLSIEYFEKNASNILFLDFLPYILPFFVTLFIALFFKENFLKKSRDEVDKILINSSDKNTDTKIKICNKKGETTPIILVIILGFAISFLESAIVDILIDGFVDSLFRF